MTAGLFNSCFLRVVLIATCLGLATGARDLPAADDGSVFERARVLETEAMGLLLEHFSFEESLLAPDNDRVSIFVSVPQGSRMVLQQVTLFFNGKPVVTHRYTVGELQRFLSEAAQPIYMTRVPQGEHSLQLDVKVMQGIVQPMQTFRFTKGKAAKYIDLRIAGDGAREVVPVEW